MSDYVYPELPSQIWPVQREHVWSGLHVEKTANGREFRSLSSTYPQIGYGIRYSALDARRYEAQRLIDLYNSMGSGLDYFLFRDRDDDRVTLQDIGVTNGTTASWQLGRAWGNLPMNLLAYSGAPMNGWTEAGLTPSLGYPSRDTLDATLLTENTSPGAGHITHQTDVPVVPGQEYTFVGKFLANGRRKVRLSVYDDVAVALIGHADVDLLTGAYATSGAVVDFGMRTLADGMSQAWVTVTNGATIAIARARVVLLDNSGASAYTGDGVSGMWFADAEFYRGRFLGSSTQRTVGAVPPVQFLAPVFDLAGAPSIYLADASGVALQLPADYTVGATGLLTFDTAPASGKRLLWSGGYYQRCRFTDTSLSTDQFTRNLFSSQQVKLLSVKP